MPDKKEVNGSMFDTVAELIVTKEEHDLRISNLEQSDKSQADSIEFLTREFADISTNFTRMENTILHSAQSTQEIMRTQNTQQWELIKTLNAGNQEDKVRKHEITKTKLDRFWEFAGKLFMGGGAAIVALELLFGK